jgi:hypothetical protein
MGGIISFTEIVIALITGITGICKFSTHRS